jgi:hypothetical protein
MGQTLRVQKEPEQRVPLGWPVEQCAVPLVLVLQNLPLVVQVLQQTVQMQVP